MEAARKLQDGAWRQLPEMPLEHEILTPDRMAVALGYVKDGEPNVKAFEQWSAKVGVPRHKLNNKKSVYIRREVIEFLRRLPG